MKKEQIYILEGELREEIIWLYHSTPVERYVMRALKRE